MLEDPLSKYAYHCCYQFTLTTGGTGLGDATIHTNKPLSCATLADMRNSLIQSLAGSIKDVIFTATPVLIETRP